MKRVADLAHDHRAVFVARWAAFLGLSWLVLRPALVVTISLDDFVNPFFVFDVYGPSPFGMVRSVSRDLTRAGHFNYIGQNVGAVVYVAWAYLMSWGVRYSLIYATTKFVVLVLTAVVAARVVRRLAAMLGREVGLWSSRVAVAGALFLTLQIHVAWSLDPVGSFPLSGYLSVVIGLWAFDLGCSALGRTDRRSLAISAAMWCVAILYYELNVVMVVALVPIVVLAWRDAPTGRRDLARRSMLMVAPAFVMTVVLQRIAASANRGYTGTDVEVASGSVRVVARAILGSLPAAAWPQARDWLGQPIGLFATVVVTFAVVLASLWWWSLRRDARPLPAERPAASRVLLVLAAPMVMWLGATAIQSTTQKVQAETVRVGFVYLYYAYGSVAVVLIGVLVVPWLTALRWWPAARPIVVTLGVTFVLVQLAVNDNVQRVFDERLVANADLLRVYADDAPAAERCAALAEWDALPYWLPYYRDQLHRGIDAAYVHFHHEPFCPVP